MIDRTAQSIVESALARRAPLAPHEPPPWWPTPRQRNHPKRHGENRERSRADAAKARKAKIAKAQHETAVESYTEQVRAYWRGERDYHP